jgi:hypothetical protein
MIDREALRAEALRIHLRYSIEVVEAFGFCPWAEAARMQGRVRTTIVFGNASDTAETFQAAILEEVDALESIEHLDVGLIVFPELTLSRLEFQHLAAHVRARYAQARARGDTSFALADFHPDAQPDLTTPERLVPFIRASPDPTFQLIRHCALDATRLGSPGTRFVDPDLLSGLELGSTPAAHIEPVHARLARANLHAVERSGVERVRALLAEIVRDRDESYARLGVPLPPWSSPRHAAAEM